MRGSRTKDELKAKVIETKINNPDFKLRETAENTGLPISSVKAILDNDLPEVCKSSQNVWNLIDRNNNLHSLADKRLQELLLNPDKEIKASDLVQIRDSSFKQNQLITEKPTENETITIKWDN